MVTVKQVVKALKEMQAWPPKDYPRRTEDGYPEEMVYDEFAYRRIVDTYRIAIRDLIARIDAGYRPTTYYATDDYTGEIPTRVPPPEWG